MLIMLMAKIGSNFNAARKNLTYQINFLKKLHNLQKHWNGPKADSA